MFCKTADKANFAVKYRTREENRREFFEDNQLGDVIRQSNAADKDAVARAMQNAFVLLGDEKACVRELSFLDRRLGALTKRLGVVDEIAGLHINHLIAVDGRFYFATALIGYATN